MRRVIPYFGPQSFRPFPAAFNVQISSAQRQPQAEREGDAEVQQSGRNPGLAIESRRKGLRPETPRAARSSGGEDLSHARRSRSHRRSACEFSSTGSRASTCTGRGDVLSLPLAKPALFWGTFPAGLRLF
jgi:hypothetical protein